MALTSIFAHAATVLVWAAGFILYLTLDDPRLRYPASLATWALMCGGWIAFCMAARQGRLAKHLAYAIALFALIFRIAAWSSPPAFSEDVFRLVYEGRVAQIRGPSFPFVVPPREGPEPQHNLPDRLFDESWLRINHPEISTIYPPFAQLVFVIGAMTGDLFGGRHHLESLKFFLILADLGTWGFLILALRLRRRPWTHSLVYGACPLVILEIAREGHADSLSTLGLAVALYGWSAGRSSLSYVGCALAAAAKLNGLVALPAFVRAIVEKPIKTWALSLLVLLPLACVPLIAGPQALRGLSEYATRWQAGDGAFSLLLMAAEFVLGGDYLSINPNVMGLEGLAHLTLTRHTLARALSLMTFMIISVVLLRRRGEMDDVPERAGKLILFLLLLSTTVHPWYVVWTLPFATISRGAVFAAATVFVSLSALLHHPGWFELQTGQWTDVLAIRLLVHLPVWATLLWLGARPARAAKPAT